MKKKNIIHNSLQPLTFDMFFHFITFIPFTFYLSAFRLYLFQVRIRRVTARWASAPGLGGLGWSVRWMATWGLLPQAPIGRPLPSTAAEFLLGTSFLGDTKMVWLGKTWLSFLGGSPTTHSTCSHCFSDPKLLAVSALNSGRVVSGRKFNQCSCFPSMINKACVVFSPQQ